MVARDVKTVEKKLNRQLVGNVGMYYCCYRLSLLGWNVMPTARNARGVDIVIYSQDAKRRRAIQVKTLSKHPDIAVARSLEDISGDFWLVASDAAPSPEPDVPTVYVLRTSEIKKLAGRSENKVGHVSYWLSVKKYRRKLFEEKWGRIGRGDI